MFSCAEQCPSCDLSNPKMAACCSCCHRGNLTPSGEGESLKIAKCETAKTTVKFHGGTPAKIYCKHYRRMP